MIYLKDKDENVRFPMERRKWREEKRLEIIILIEKC